VVRKLAKGMGRMPADAAAADAFEQAAVTAHDITAAELTTATATVDGERDLLIRLVLKQLGKPITGVSIDRDLKVVLEMGKTPGTWSEMLKVRPPSAFPIP
jgi:hypothetical protein